MKKLLTILLTLVMAICLINLNNSITKADDDSNATPLTFTSTGNSIITFCYTSGTNVFFNKNDAGWSTYNNATPITLTDGDTVSFKGTNVKTNYSNFFLMEGSGSIAASGDVTSLTNGVGGDVALSNDCYSYMSAGCTNLTTPPNLPSTTLASGCYKNMFNGCTNLTKIPTLPATTLYDNCYNSMFYGCSKLKISTTKDSTYKYQYRIPSSGTGTTAAGALTDMFFATGGAFTSTPSINTVYYTANELVPAVPTPIPTPEEGDMTYDDTITVGDTPGAFVDSVQKGNASKNMHVIDMAANANTTKVYIKKTDGTWETSALGSASYTLTSDSTTSPKYTKLSFNSDYLNNLDAGTYDYKVVLDDSASNTQATFYIELTVTNKPSPTPEPSKKDESCEKVIGPTWHWNNKKGICEDTGVVNTYTR